MQSGIVYCGLTSPPLNLILGKMDVVFFRPKRKKDLPGCYQSQVMGCINVHSCQGSVLVHNITQIVSLVCCVRVLVVFDL